MKNRTIYIIFPFFFVVLTNPFDLSAQRCLHKHLQQYAEAAREKLEQNAPDTVEVVTGEIYPIIQAGVEAEPFFLDKMFGQRFNRKIENYLYAPKGSWMVGLTVSYLTFDSKESQLLSLLKDFDCTAYTVQVNPFFSYFFRDNLSAGIRFSYGRTFGRLDNLELDFGDDLDLSVNDVFYQQQIYTGTGFVRTYIGLDKEKRFGLFNETSISFGGGTAKFVSGKGEAVTGTYSEIRKLNVGFKPGLSVFIMNNAAVEVSFGVAGFNYRKETQITDQVEESVFRNSGANFKINLFNINIGIIICI
ncbi:MAG: hypothetical protein LUH10_11835 [Tannerellaceae bacterium]|nr:hypothetical protein [Tannerellaceae bacterium]